MSVLDPQVGGHVTITNERNLPDWLQPGMEYAMDEARTAYDNYQPNETAMQGYQNIADMQAADIPGLQEAQDYYTRLMNGDYLYGGDAFNAAQEAAYNRIAPQVQSAFGLANGSAALGQKQLTELLGDSFALQYGQERQLQNQGLGYAGDMAQLAYLPDQMRIEAGLGMQGLEEKGLNDYINRMTGIADASGYSETSEQPWFENDLADILGTVTTGADLLGKLFGDDGLFSGVGDMAQDAILNVVKNAFPDLPWDDWFPQGGSPGTGTTGGPGGGTTGGGPGTGADTGAPGTGADAGGGTGGSGGTGGGTGGAGAGTTGIQPGGVNNPGYTPGGGGGGLAPGGGAPGGPGSFAGGVGQGVFTPGAGHVAGGGAGGVVQAGPGMPGFSGGPGYVAGSVPGMVGGAAGTGALTGIPAAGALNLGAASMGGALGSGAAGVPAATFAGAPLLGLGLAAAIGAPTFKALANSLMGKSSNDAANAAVDNLGALSRSGGSINIGGQTYQVGDAEQPYTGETALTQQYNSFGVKGTEREGGGYDYYFEVQHPSGEIRVVPRGQSRVAAGEMRKKMEDDARAANLDIAGGIFGAENVIGAPVESNTPGEKGLAPVATIRVADTEDPNSYNSYTYADLEYMQNQLGIAGNNG
jgi:hypothetical protein